MDENDLWLRRWLAYFEQRHDWLDFFDSLLLSISEEYSSRNCFSCSSIDLTNRTTGREMLGASDFTFQGPCCVLSKIDWSVTIAAAHLSLGLSPESAKLSRHSSRWVVYRQLSTCRKDIEILQDFSFEITQVWLKRSYLRRPENEVAEQCSFIFGRFCRFDNALLHRFM